MRRPATTMSQDCEDRLSERSQNMVRTSDPDRFIARCDQAFSIFPSHSHSFAGVLREPK
jgi:hypothetical protein